jgi:hypothetical protein
MPDRTPTEIELLTSLLEAAREHLRWQRAAVTPAVRETVESTLSTDAMREAFELCDGATASAEIAKAVGTSPQNFSGWSRRWRDLGIAYEVERRKVKHLASLKSLGIPVKTTEP